MQAEREIEIRIVDQRPELLGQQAMSRADTGGEALAVELGGQAPVDRAREILEVCGKFLRRLAQSGGGGSSFRMRRQRVDAVAEPLHESVERRRRRVVRLLVGRGGERRSGRGDLRALARQSEREAHGGHVALGDRGERVAHAIVREEGHHTRQNRQRRNGAEGKEEAGPNAEAAARVCFRNCRCHASSFPAHRFAPVVFP